MIHETITLKGLTFRVTCEPDCDMGPPWKEHDGHGEVRETRCYKYVALVEKRPGERVLHSEGGTAWLYDWQSATVTAKRDRWGLCDDDKAKLAETLGRAPTADEITAEAVRRDFDHLHCYCEGDWSWITLCVTLLDCDEEPTEEREYLGGIESDADEYINSEALGLAGEIAKRVGQRKFIQKRVRVRK